MSALRRPRYGNLRKTLRIPTKKFTTSYGLDTHPEGKFVALYAMYVLDTYPKNTGRQNILLVVELENPDRFILVGFIRTCPSPELANCVHLDLRFVVENVISERGRRALKM